MSEGRRELRPDERGIPSENWVGGGTNGKSSSRTMGTVGVGKVLPSRARAFQVPDARERYEVSPRSKVPTLVEVARAASSVPPRD